MPSLQLGIPTANIPVESLRVGGYEDVDSGVYYGWAWLKMPAASAAPRREPEEGLQKEGRAAKVRPALLDHQISSDSHAHRTSILILCSALPRSNKLLVSMAWM